MFSNPKKKLVAAISKSTGVDSSAVSTVLEELANQAYASASTNFALPGFGAFRITRAADRTGVNPFTGKETVFRGPRQVEFTLDTKAEKAFLAGEDKTPVNDLNAPPPVALPPVYLTPDRDDMAKASIANPKEEPSCWIGGEPSWLQAPQQPVCCGGAMLFYGQLDSLGGDFSIGDGGILYVFFCRECCSTHTVLQF